MKNEFSKLVGARVRAMREQKQITGPAIAEAIGLTASAVYSIEAGRYDVSAKTLFLLSVILSCPVEVLYPLKSEFKPRLKVLVAREKAKRSSKRVTDTLNNFLDLLNDAV